MGEIPPVMGKDLEEVSSFMREFFGKFTNRIVHTLRFSRHVATIESQSGKKAGDNTNESDPSKLKTELLEQNKLIEQLQSQLETALRERDAILVRYIKSSPKTEPDKRGVEALEAELSDQTKRVERVQSELREVRMELLTNHTNNGATLEEEEAKLMAQLVKSRRIQQAVRLRLIQERAEIQFKESIKNGIDLLEGELSKQNQFIEKIQEEINKHQTWIEEWTDENSGSTQKALLQSKNALSEELKHNKRIRDAILLRIIQEKVDSQVQRELNDGKIRKK